MLVTLQFSVVSWLLGSFPDACDEGLNKGELMLKIWR